MFQQPQSHRSALVAYTDRMRITPDTDDAPDFVRQVEQVVNGVSRRHAPEALALIKIDNFFGSKWLGFSGRALGAISLWANPSYHPAAIVKIPPFVPNRVVSQRRFSAPSYEEIHCGDPIHKRMPSRVALKRTVAIAAPKSALVWYSGEFKVNGRGAVMAYVPAGDSYWLWYAAFETGESWNVAETLDIKRDDLASLMEQGSDAIQSILRDNCR
ncbi:MAG: hypothetical protein ABR880_22960 [Candidatus Sulfotelmatobacter sp.]|jgi:hypothetical protein